VGRTVCNAVATDDDSAHMPSDHLSTYLNDHLAGAVAAIEMLDHVAEKHAGLVDATVVLQVRTDVEEDRATLEALMERLGVHHSRTRKAVGWLAERFTRIKVAVDDRGDGDFRAFETIQLISLGIEGKIALWRSLAVIAPTDPVLSGVAYAHLISRAERQRVALEPLHELTARVALAEPNRS
jgi:hypothetical protein